MPDTPPRARALAAALALSLGLVETRADAQVPVPASDDAAIAATAAEGPAALDVASSLALALEANPTLRAAVFDAAAARADARVAETARTPTFTASSLGQYNESIGGTANGANRTRSWAIQSQAALSFTTNVGTVVSVTVGSTTQWRQAGLTPGVTTVVTIGPTHSASATVTARQPLLRGRGRDAVLADQRAAEARALSSEADATVAASQLVRDVLSAYWELWYADRALQVQREAVELATRQAALAQQQRTLGTIAPADVLQFVTAEASLREQIATAEATRTSRAVAFGRLLAIGSEDSERLQIDASAPGEPETPMLATLLGRMRADSPQIQALEADVEAARASAVAARNAARARLDATGSAGLAGLWMEDAYQGLTLPGGRPAVVASVGLELELPVSSERRAAQRASADAAVEAAESRLAASVAQLEADLASQLASFRSAVARTSLTVDTARVSEQLAEAERGRLGLGTSTPNVLLQAQQTARESVLRHDRALADAAVASLSLEHGAGTLLDRFDLPAPEGTSGGAR